LAQQANLVSQLSFIWNIKTNLGSTSKFSFYADGGTGTPYESTKVQYFAVAKSYRSDYAVTGLVQAASASFYDALEDEARDALSEMQLKEEQAIISGSDTSAYGITSAWDGLLQLMGSNATFSDTDTVFGTARAGARDELDVSLVAAGATSQDALDLKDLDTAILKSDDKGAKGHRRIFFCTTARGYELNQLLQPQGRFVLGAGALELEGGTRVSTYMGIPIVTSRYMDKNGITWDGSTKTKSYTDAAMYLLDLDYIEMRVVSGVDKQHIPVNGNATDVRKDEIGGYFKTYGVLVMRRFQTQVLLYNLSVP